jgi:FkbM family methyltransferase
MKKKCLFDSELCFEMGSSLEEYRVESIFDKEPETIAWIDDISIAGGTFYDIGANIGIYSMYACYKNSELHVYSFEPVTNNFIALQKNIALNKFSNISAFNVAISNSNKITNLFLSDIREGNSGAQIDSPINENGELFGPLKIEKVLSFSMDFLIENLNLPVPNFLKIDVDGHETDILKGMEKTLSNVKLKEILVEFNNLFDFEEWQLKLENNGLFLNTKYDFLPNHSGIRRATKGSLTRNYLFKRK